MGQEIFAKLARISIETGWALTHEFILTANGGAQFDVEDTMSNSWIRVELPSNGGLLLRVPAGAQYRLSFEKQNLNAVGVAFIKGVLADMKIIEPKDLNSHPARKAYLRSIGQV
ncbi:hypothetical protein BT96DRAFT_921916 [Gymnopus androsaceus JB14]|uniref:Uncharacterized protein n=1 Tax=Gymnopus androsaceus JB14 TaxID=1447944 RepID=A0A6A4HI34_9AGAR|nr:hypothetical protein BT96DRAFT_921916 [Gymnopus androsaceus JB14]